MKRILVIGDIHLGKKFNTYKPNPYSNLNENLQQIWTKLTVNYIKNVLSNTKHLTDIVFLGDIFDHPSLRPEIIYLFTDLILFIQKNFKDTVIHILVGNHDTIEPQNKAGTLLSTYNSYKNVNVYQNLTFLDYNFVMFPYYKRENLSDKLVELSTFKNLPIIFSHNDFYVNDTFIQTEMINVNFFDEFFEKYYIFNGHIHNYYYEPSNGIFFTGSVSPTSFKDSPFASGICLVDFKNGILNKFQKFTNTYLTFITINDKIYFERLEELLQKYRKYKIKTILRFPNKLTKNIEPILQKYNDIIIYFKPKITEDENPVNFNCILDKEELNKVTSKVRNIIESNYTKDEFNQIFADYIHEKYGFNLKEMVGKIPTIKNLT